MDPIKAAIDATKAEWSHFFNGTVTDAHAFLEAMVTDLATAKMNMDTATQKTVEAQFRALAESKRISARNGTWAVALAWIRAAIRAALLAAGKPA